MNYYRGEFSKVSEMTRINFWQVAVSYSSSYDSSHNCYRSGSKAAHTDLIFSCCLMISVFQHLFLKYQPFLFYYQKLVYSILLMYINTYLHFHIHENLNLGRSRDTTRAYKVLGSFPITITWWKLMSTIVQLQDDKCECPNWSSRPEWWIAVFFF